MVGVNAMTVHLLMEKTMKVVWKRKMILKCANEAAIGC